MGDKVKITVGRCVMSVQGCEMNCPVCGVLVRSGESHQCEMKKVPAKRIKRKLPPQIAADTEGA